MIEAVIFDMDGTLVDSESVSVRAWRLTAQHMGIDLPKSLTDSFIGRNATSCFELMVAHVQGDEDLANRIFEQHRVDFEELTSQHLELMDGAREALAALKEMGLPLGVATSTHRDRAIPRLERFGLENEFASITCGDEVSRSKPEPDIFLAAAASLGVAPERCAVIEDSFNGVRAGHAAGSFVFMVPDLVKPTEEITALCTAVLGSLHELPDAIRANREPAC